MQDDAGTTLRLLDRGDVELAFALGRPVHAFAGGLAGAAAVDIDLVGDDERGVETDTELADQVRVFLLVTGEVLHEVGGAGLGDGAQVRDDVVAAHADAVVLEGHGAGVLVEAQADLQFRVTFEQLGLGQGLEAQLVGGIGGVGDQLAQEDFLVRVQGMDHEVQQLLYLGLEAQGFFLNLHTHGLQNSDLMTVIARRPEWTAFAAGCHADGGCPDDFKGFSGSILKCARAVAIGDCRSACQAVIATLVTRRP
ncbi:hypothetical protein D3C81_664430 [compost metagenome]